jgi:hypothetical protein
MAGPKITLYVDLVSPFSYMAYYLIKVRDKTKSGGGIRHRHYQSRVIAMDLLYIADKPTTAELPSIHSLPEVLCPSPAGRYHQRHGQYPAN